VFTKGSRVYRRDAERMTKVYLAHNFDAREWLAGTVLPLLEQNGIKVTSRWITDDSHMMSIYNAQSARHDVDDIAEADCLVLFVDQFSDRPGRGKYVELGIAHAMRKTIILCGSDDSCIFYHLSGLIRIQSYTDLVDAIEGGIA
jgi:nucleoside 2-deoxyribosyltransferase